MTFGAMPTIRIEMESVKYEVIHAFADAQEEIKQYAADAISASMNQLMMGGLEAAIIEAVTSTMQDTIEKMISEVVSEAVDEYFSGPIGTEFIQSAIQSYISHKEK